MVDVVVFSNGGNCYDENSKKDVAIYERPYEK